MTFFAGALPLMAFLVLWGLANVLIRRQRPSASWPYGEAFLVTALVWGICVTFFTEVLSAFRALTAPSLAVCWLVVILVGAGVLAVLGVRLRQVGGFRMWDSASTHSNIVQREKHTGAWYVSVGIVAIILVVTGITAAMATPNNWDAMTYHLARVQHWIQNQSVGFYPTNNTRQLFDPPWAEYALLQFQLLTHSDILANFVQWFSGLGVCVGAALIAQRLGANQTGQGLAMIVAATIPMAILQSSSPQNDLVTSFWIVCCIYFALSFARNPNLFHAFALGAALGLAALTKGTAFVFAAPVVLGLGIWLVAHLRGQRAPGPSGRSWGGVLGLLGIVAVLALLLNGAQFARNELAFHSPLGPDGAAYANQTFAPSALVCNAARDVSLELGTPSETLNARLYDGIHAFCGALGVSVDDPRISWTAPGGLPFRINPFNTYEGTAGNLAQFALILLALALILVVARLRARHEVLGYAVLLLLGYILFVCYLRWQPWGNRLLLPWFIAAAPLVGVALDQFFAWRVSAPLLGLALLLLATPFLLFNRNDPLIGASTVFTTPRTAQYFVSNTGVERPYYDAARFVNQRGCLSIGFHSGVEGWEYPFWLLIGSQPYQAHIEQVLVTNQSARFASEPSYQDFHPCAIINVIDRAAPVPTTLMVNGTMYQSSWSDAVVAVYLPLARQA
jgi:4-amino-4-deoxy-L-arabinose transferase-like glycosyltransferase